MDQQPNTSHQEKVAEEFDTYHDSYADTVNSALAVTGMKVDRFIRAKARHIVNESISHFGNSNGLSALDVGCGIGQYQTLLKDDFLQLAGIDVSEASLKQARASNPDAQYCHYDGNVMPFDDNTFDVTFAVCVMHHVPVANWTSFVSEMHRVTKTGGLSLLLEHSTIHPLTRYVVNNCPFDADAVLVKRGRAKEIFEHCGFQDVEIRSILTIPAVDGVLKSIDTALGWLPFGTQYCLKATKR